MHVFLFVYDGPVSRVHFLKRELTQVCPANSVISAEKKTQWVTFGTGTKGWEELTDFSPGTRWGPQKLTTELSVWNRALWNCIRACFRRTLGLDKSFLEVLILIVKAGEHLWRIASQTLNVTFRPLNRASVWGVLRIISKCSIWRFVLQFKTFGGQFPSADVPP